MAMSEDYTDIIQQVSQLVFEAIQEREENLSTQVKELDGELAKLLRLVGHEVMSRRAGSLARREASPLGSYAALKDTAAHNAGSLVNVSQ